MLCLSTSSTATPASTHHGADSQPVPIHNTISRPTPPGPWVDRHECECGATFDDFRGFESGVDAWDQGLELLRLMNEDYHPSRGPVIHAAHCIKLRRWYEVHATCSAAEAHWLAARGEG